MILTQSCAVSDKHTQNKECGKKCTYFRPCMEKEGKEYYIAKEEYYFLKSINKIFKSNKKLTPDQDKQLTDFRFKYGV